MKTKELRELTQQELDQRLREATEALVNLRVQVATSDLEDNKGIWRIKKDIARIKTLLREAELEREKSSG